MTRNANARLHDALGPYRIIEVDLVHHWADPNRVKSHTVNIIQAGREGGPSTAAVNVEGKGERRNKGAGGACGACKAIG